MDKSLFDPSLTAAVKKLHPQDGEQILEYLRTQALLSQEKALLQASLRDQKKLLVENGKLKRDIEQLRTQLQRRRTKALLAPPPPKVTHVNQPSSQRATCSPQEPGEPQNQRRRRGEERALAMEAEPKLDVSRLDLRVGQIVGARRHPQVATLSVQEVDVGEKVPRTVVRSHREKPHLEQGDFAIFLCNVKASKKRGVASQARILRCWSSDDVTELLVPPTGSSPGDRVTFLNYPGEPDKELQSKQRIWEVLQPDMQVDGRGVAKYKGCGFEVKGKGLCRAPSLTDCIIR
ncbi:hypothetical protein fugu_002101 [Takifugu bimaculatus]|uniref:tRNA-binding domain-containing protein n=1 Tax=Takifugu bimaculatus TaxID=433685 RepID=A0A4Z2BNR2_9TELE|nr:hypothetical protein fugu_002101 [Takifugu bimaculatus]